MSDYKVISAMKTRDYKTQYGDNTAYAVMLEGESEAVEVGQKSTTPAPKAGDTLSGSIEAGQYGRKFKKDYQVGGQRPGRDNPESRESIEWQTSLKEGRQAVRDYFDLNTATKKMSIEEYVKEVDKVAVHFHNIITAKPKSVTTNAEKADTPEPVDVLPTDEEVDEVNPDDIPF